MDSLDGNTSIADMGGSTSAASGALALEGPSKAHRLSRVLGDVAVVSFHHFRDSGMATVGEATLEVSVNMGVDHHCRARLAACAASRWIISG